MHPTLPQLELALCAASNDQQLTLDVAFMHQSLCIAGLPVRAPQSTTYTRRGINFDLRLDTPDLTIPGTDIVVPIGVPHGTKPRLLTIWMVSQAKLNSRSRFLELGPINEFMQAIGVPNKGEANAQTKAAAIKLSRTNFDITVRGMFAGRDSLAWTNERMIESAILATEDALHYRDGHMDRVRWPIGIEISAKAWSRFARDAIPIPMARLREISHSATAIDLFLYLSYRLPLIPDGKTELATWKQLHQQFSPNDKGTPARFRANCNGALTAAMRAYPEAKLEDTPEGLLMHHSEPALLNRSFFAISSATTAKKRRAVRNRVDNQRSLEMT